MVTMPRDRAGTFEPPVARRHPRLTGVEEIVLSLSACPGGCHRRGPCAVS